MGIMKRILRKASSKLLASIGAQKNSHQLNVGTPVSNKLKHSTVGSHQLASSRRANRLRRKSRDSGIPEALLVAAKNYMPPVQFHHVHGPNAQLSKNKSVARRTKGFCQGLVFSNRVIMPNERVYIKVLEIAKGWSGTIRFGFTSVDPATLCYQMPKHACPDMTNAGHTWARALADEVVRRNSVIHFSYNTNGYIHYGINNQDCGVFYANVNTSQHLWFIVDIYGQTAAVELIDPRIHNAASTSELDLSRLTADEPTQDVIPEGLSPLEMCVWCGIKDHNKITNPQLGANSQASSAILSKSSSASPPKDSNISDKLKTRHPSTTRTPKSKSTSHRANDNNSPPQSKDCPICFERPINCVLYQCGHMCTCYECGVKQWRTQSKTCPICRTVIKDVIKTYMS